MKKILLLLVVLCVSHFLKAQTDTLFWFVAPRITSFHSPLPVEFKMASFNDFPVTVIFSKPSDDTFTPVVVTIPSNGDATISYTTTAEADMFENKPPNTINNQGVLIESTGYINVYYEVSTGANNPEIFTLKGKNALGTDFMIPGQTEYKNANFVPRPCNSIDIVATENETSITIIPTQVLIGGRLANVPFTIILDKGQTFCCAAIDVGSAYHLQGTTITSDKPIAITVTDDSLELGAGADLAGVQIVPTGRIGNEYIAIKGGLSEYGGQVHEKVYILAIEDDTKVYPKGETWPVIINRGQTLVTTFTSEESAIYIRSNKPVYAYQLTGQEFEFGAVLLPPVHCTGSRKVKYKRGPIGTMKFNICIRNGSQSDFKVNGMTDVLVGSDFLPVPGTKDEWVYTSKTIPTTVADTNSVVTIENDALFHLGVFGAPQGGCNYDYFSDYGVDAKEFLSFDEASMYCLGDDIQLFLADHAMLDNVTWTGPNGFESNEIKPIIPNITDKEEGVYIVTGYSKYDCEIMSGVITVTIDEPKATVTSKNVICGNPGNAKIEAYGGIVPYNIHWQTNNGTELSDDVFEINDLLEGNYSFTITDSLECMVEDTFVISFEGENPNASFTIESYELESCMSEAVFYNLSDKTEGNVCEWHFGDGVSASSCAEEVKHKYGQAGCYEPYLLVYNNDIPECRDSAFIEDCILVKDNLSAGLNPMPAEIKISPNPAKEYINIEFKKYDYIDVLTIFDVNGKEVRTKTNFYGGTIDVADLPSGIYIIVCKIGKEGYSQKLIIE